MNRVGKDYKAYLKELVRAAGREIINRADDIVGNGDMISDLSLWVRFDQGEVPRIEISREHIIKESLNIIFGEKPDEGQRAAAGEEDKDGDNHTGICGHDPAGDPGHIGE